MKKECFHEKGKVLCLLFLAVLAVSLSCPSFLQAKEEAPYPQKPIEFVVNWAPGGSADIGARLLAENVSKILGQPLIVNNKAGGSGVVGTLYSAKAKPDGYTIYLSNNALFGSFYAIAKNIPYKLSDFDHICRAVTYPNIFVVKADSPWKSVGEVVAYIKKNPGKIIYGSAGIGTSTHFVTELFKLEIGLDIPHVPFKQGVEAATAILGGHVQMGILSEAHVVSFLKAGQLKALAVTSEKRLSAYPDIPTMIEVGYPRCVSVAYLGASGPQGVPKAIIGKLAGAFKETLQDAQVRKNLTQNGLYPDFMDSAEYAKFIEEEAKKYKEVAQKANIALK